VTFREGLLAKDFQLSSIKANDTRSLQEFIEVGTHGQVSAGQRLNDKLSQWKDVRPVGSFRLSGNSRDERLRVVDYKVFRRPGGRNPHLRNVLESGLVCLKVCLPVATTQEQVLGYIRELGSHQWFIKGTYGS